MHRSPYFGQSIEFLQHREYVPGDDLRHLDWKVWARQDRYYIKQFEEETNLRCTLLVDVSNSMRYGRGALSKFEYACTAAVSMAYLILKQQDAVGCVAFDEGIRNAIPIRSRRNHLDSVIHALEVSEPRDKTDIFRMMQNVAENYPRRGMIILFSDLFVDRATLFKGLRMLRQRGHDVLIVHIMDDDELDFTFNGPMRFDGMELPEHLSCNPRSLRDAYLEVVGDYLEEVRRGCAKNTVDYALVRTSEPLDAALAAFLSNRLGMHHRN
ncbi:MAG: DUF58 domain-containing protein [Pirellulales bacterium]|nr:DUF58 domain-containing protein [Pirellulales bacterium]